MPSLRTVTIGAVVALGAVATTFVLVDRGACDFVTKARNVQDAGAIAMVVVDNAPGDVIGLSGDDPSITIPSVRITLSDNGPGIAPEVAPRLFTPFTTSKAGGLGLGLSLSQTLAQGMGGDLSGVNMGAGGAVFTLSLPRLALEAASD